MNELHVTAPISYPPFDTVEDGHKDTTTTPLSDPLFEENKIAKQLNPLPFPCN